jgi:hypothetical protein
MVDKHPRESALADRKAIDEALISIHRLVNSMPGADDGEGLLILSDGRLRKVIRCDALNSRSFDKSSLQNIARVFSEVAASLEAEIQILFSTVDLTEPEFLARHRITVSTDSEYIRWLSERCEQWFKQVYALQQVHGSNQHLFLVVTCAPSPEPVIQQNWNGTEVYLPAESVAKCQRQILRIFDGLSQCNIQPKILDRRELRMLLAQHSGLSELTTETKAETETETETETEYRVARLDNRAASTSSISDSNPQPITRTATSNVTTSTKCGTPDGMLFGFKTNSNEPVLFNPFFRGAGKYNNNLLIAGTPALNSLAIMVLILRLLPFGVRFILLSDNVGRFSSYQFLADLLGPEDCVKISLADGSKDVINPFDLTWCDFHSRPSGDKIRSLLSLFDLMLAPEGREELSIQEKALLSRVILRAYEEALTRATVPSMSEFAALLEQTAAEEPDTFKRKLLQNLACGLSIFTKSGAYSSFLDGQTNIDLNKKLLICETKNISGLRYQKAVAYTLNQFIEKEALRGKTIGKRFALLVHPSTGLMMSEPGLEMLENFSAGTRQHAMMFGVASDQIRTLCSKTPLLVKNAHTKLFLPQEFEELSVLKSELKLTNEQVQAINSLSLNDGSLECCLNVGNTSGTAELTMSPLEYWICTEEPITNIPKRMCKIREFQTKYKDLKHAEALRMAVYSLSIENR